MQTGDPNPARAAFLHQPPVVTTADSSSPLALPVQSTRLAVHSTDDSKGECQLALNGNLLADRFDNTILDAQYEVADGCLLAVLGSDSPWDVTASLYLLDSTGRNHRCHPRWRHVCRWRLCRVGLDAAGVDLRLSGCGKPLSAQRQPACRLAIATASGWRYQRWWATIVCICCSSIDHLTAEPAFMADDKKQDFETALREFELAANNFAIRFIKMAEVRAGIAIRHRR